VSKISPSSLSISIATSQLFLQGVYLLWLTTFRCKTLDNMSLLSYLQGYSTEFFSSVFGRIHYINHPLPSPNGLQLLRSERINMPEFLDASDFSHSPLQWKVIVKRMHHAVFTYSMYCWLLDARRLEAISINLLIYSTSPAANKVAVCSETGAAVLFPSLRHLQEICSVLLTQAGVSHTHRLYSSYRRCHDLQQAGADRKRVRGGGLFHGI